MQALGSIVRTQCTMCPLIQVQSHGAVHAESQDQTWSWQWTSQKPDHLTAVRSRTPGWSGISLTHLLLVCISFPPLLSFFHVCTHSFSLFLLSVPPKSHKQFSAVLLHFLLLHHFLSFDSLCFQANYSLSKYAIERHIRSSKTISKLINNCQVRGKAEVHGPL